jgi:hypothetical protein
MYGYGAVSVSLFNMLKVCWLDATLFDLYIFLSIEKYSSEHISDTH